MSHTVVPECDAESYLESTLHMKLVCPPLVPECDAEIGLGVTYHEVPDSGADLGTESGKRSFRKSQFHYPADNW